MTSPSEAPGGTARTTNPLPPVPQSDFDPGVQISSPTDSNSTDTNIPSCPFCHIASTYPPYDPTSPPPSSTTTTIIDPSATSPQPPTYLVLSTKTLISFLDIMPLSQGHILLCTRKHRSKLTDVTADEARELGYYLRVLSSAVSRVTGVQDWNVVQNNGAAAAQVVPHMHFHVIPRPELRDKGRERFTSTMFGRGQREDLDEEEAEVLAERIRGMVKVVIEEERGVDEEATTGRGKGKDSKL